jgi:molybdopterin synthase catalytic subunit
MKNISIQEKPVNIAEILETGSSDSDGSDVIFIGRVRNNSKGKDVTLIDYDIYPEMALKELHKIADEAIEKSELNRCIIVHRYGRVYPGETSIAIIVSAPHRAQTYEGSRYIIDEIKKRVPIWKKEQYSDGSEWLSDRS